MASDKFGGYAAAALLGKLGEVVAYASLPTSVQSTALANALLAAGPAPVPYSPPPSSTPPSFALVHESMRLMYQESSRYVYSIKGLNGGQPKYSPCQANSRWQQLETSCVSTATNLNEDTKTTLAAAIRSSADASNSYVRDVALSAVSGGGCTDDSKATGAKVDVDGGCWEHIYEFDLNIYDFTEV